MNAQPAAQSAAEPPPAATPPAHLRRLVLTGFMGAGKTTVGRLLAARLNWDFLDLDAYIGPGLRPRPQPPGPRPRRWSARGPHQPPPHRADPSHLHHLPRRPIPRPLRPLYDAGPQPRARLGDERRNRPRAQPSRRQLSRARPPRAAPPSARRSRRRRGPLPRPPAHLPPPRLPHPRHRRPHPRRDRRRPPRSPHLSRIDIEFNRKELNHSEAVIRAEFGAHLRQTQSKSLSGAKPQEPRCIRGRHNRPLLSPAKPQPLLLMLSVLFP